MDIIKGIETEYGIIEGRDGIYLDSISYPDESTLILRGDFNTPKDFKKYEIKFSGIVYLHSIELDFGERKSMASFGVIDNSVLIQKLQKTNHSNKLKPHHKHFYFQTYDTIFELVAEDYDLKT